MNYIVAIVCVIGIAAGQILFRLSAIASEQNGTFLNYKTIAILMCAFALYGVTTIAWVWVLQKSELGKVYPFMALAFVIVPIASYFLLGERFTTQYYIGVLFIISGIIFTIKN